MPRGLAEAGDSCENGPNDSSSEQLSPAGAGLGYQSHSIRFYAIEALCTSPVHYFLHGFVVVPLHLAVRYLTVPLCGLNASVPKKLLDSG